MHKILLYVTILFQTDGSNWDFFEPVSKKADAIDLIRVGTAIELVCST